MNCKLDTSSVYYVHYFVVCLLPLEYQAAWGSIIVSLDCCWIPSVTDNAWYIAGIQYIFAEYLNDNFREEGQNNISKVAK